MQTKESLKIRVNSKNLFFDHPYEIVYRENRLYFYKIKHGKPTYRFHILIKINTIISWIRKIEDNKNIIIGFSVKQNQKNKTYVSKDYDTLNKLKNELSCRCSFGNFQEFFTLSNIINKGSTGQVWKGICRASKTEVAIKYISKKELFPLNYSVLELEIEIMLKVKGLKQFVQIKDVFQDEQNYMIIMNYLKGNSLSHYLETFQTGQRLSLIQIFTIMKRILGGLLQLSHLKIMHRDIKPQNLVLAENDDFNSITLIDFGFSTYTYLNRYLLYKCGTPGYAAPEVLNSNCTQYSESCDVFSSGCLFYQLLFGDIPFQGQTIYEMVHNNKLCQIELHNKYQKDDDNFNNIIDLLQALLEKDATKRIRIEEAYERFKMLSSIQQYSENEDCCDQSPLINHLPILEIKIGKIFEQTSRTRLSLPSSAQCMIK